MASEDSDNVFLESLQSLALEQRCAEEADATTTPYQRGFEVFDATYDGLCKELSEFSLNFRKPGGAVGAAPVITISDSDDDDFNPEDVSSSDDNTDLEACAAMTPRLSQGHRLVTPTLGRLPWRLGSRSCLKIPKPGSVILSARPQAIPVILS